VNALEQLNYREPLFAQAQADGAIRFIVTSSSSPHRARGAPRRPDPASWRTETKYNDIWQGCASFSYHKNPQQELAVARWGQGERTPDTASVPVRLSKIPPRSW